MGQLSDQGSSGRSLTSGAVTPALSPSWIGSPSDPAIPQSVIDKLGPYINPLA